MNCDHDYQRLIGDIADFLDLHPARDTWQLMHDLEEELANREIERELAQSSPPRDVRYGVVGLFRKP